MEAHFFKLHPIYQPALTKLLHVHVVLDVLEIKRRFVSFCYGFFNVHLHCSLKNKKAATCITPASGVLGQKNKEEQLLWIKMLD